MQYFVYILKCADATLYTGWTNNLDKRIRAHNTLKTGARYTKTRRPVKLVYAEIYRTKSKAMKREYALKKLTKVEKVALIKENGR